MKIESAPGIHRITKSTLGMINNKETILIISKNDKESERIINSLIRRLDYKSIPYEVDTSARFIQTDDSIIEVYSELQISKIASPKYEQVIYNPLIESDSLETIKLKFGGA